jgi:hypothetical protein
MWTIYKLNERYSSLFQWEKLFYFQNVIWWLNKAIMVILINIHQCHVSNYIRQGFLFYQTNCKICSSFLNEVCCGGELIQNWNIHANFHDLCGILPIWTCRKANPDILIGTSKSKFSRNISRFMTTNPEFPTQI